MHNGFANWSTPESGAFGEGGKHHFLVESGRRASHRLSATQIQKPIAVSNSLCIVRFEIEPFHISGSFPIQISTTGEVFLAKLIVRMHVILMID
jgi:hypothetical protein